MATSASDRPRNSQMSPVAAVATASSRARVAVGATPRTVRRDARSLEGPRPGRRRGRRGHRRRRRPPAAHPARVRPGRAARAAAPPPGGGRAGGAAVAAVRRSVDYSVAPRGTLSRSRRAGRRIENLEGEMRTTTVFRPLAALLALAGLLVLLACAGSARAATAVAPPPAIADLLPAVSPPG